jgi:hypothetical protein
MGEKIICLDYDGSYTEFPKLFDIIIEKSDELGYKVILATIRYPYEVDDFLKQLKEKIPVYYTSRTAKINFLNKLGIAPSLWIDDRPEWIFKDV